MITMERRWPVEVPIPDERTGNIEMAYGQERLANLLGRAAMDVWGDMPRDIQEVVFETTMKGRDAEREKLARPLHDRVIPGPASGEAGLRNRISPREFNSSRQLPAA
jgi:hypothetical protein